MKYFVNRSKPFFFALVGACALSACSEVPPHTVAEFLDNPRLLEATMVRCTANRLELRDTAECVNAREANQRIAVRDEEAKRAQFEKDSVRKREALRRSQQAAAEARARAEETERLRREAEYLGNFDELPNGDGANSPVAENNTPGAELPAPPPTAVSQELNESENRAPELQESGATLEEVRDELRRRQQAPQD